MNRVRYAFVVLTVISLALSALAYFAAVGYYRAGVASQRQQGAVTERRLCTTLERLAALKPPAGDAAGNPSRAYEQALHAVLAELGPDVGCP